MASCPNRKLFCDVSAAFLRGVEGSIEIFLPPGELTQGFANCLLGPLARENS